MKRWGVVGLAIAALVVGLLAAPGASAHRAREAATIQVNVTPLKSNGQLKAAYRVAFTLVGANCWTGSDTIPGTYKCMLGTNILDPCWPRVDASGAYHGSYCLRTPWSHAGIVLRERHVAFDKRKGRQLWGLHTTDGYGCVAAPGANSSFHGQFLFWRCDYGKRWLLLHIDGSTAQWHATEVVVSGTHIYDAHRVGITKAWFGVSPFGLK